MLECQRKIYVLDARNVDGRGCCGFVDHFELGGGGGASARREDNMVRGKQNTSFPKSPPIPHFIFQTTIPILIVRPISVCLWPHAHFDNHVVFLLPVCQTRSQCILITISQCLASSQVCLSLILKSSSKSKGEESVEQVHQTCAEMILMQISLRVVILIYRPKEHSVTSLYWHFLLFQHFSL